MNSNNVAWEQKIELGRMTSFYTIVQLRILTPTPDFPSTSAMLKINQGKSYIFVKLDEQALQELVNAFSVFKANYSTVKLATKELEEQYKNSDEFSDIVNQTDDNDITKGVELVKKLSDVIKPTL